MSFTIGRASLPLDPAQASWNGDTLTVRGVILPTVAADINHANAVRAQLLGMVDNPDEDVFPVTASFDANWDGFYRVQSVQVDGSAGVMTVSGYMPYTVQLRKVAGGFQRPRFEHVVKVALRTNGHSVTTPTGIGYVNYSPTGYGYADADFSGLASGVSPVAFTTEDGSVVAYTITAAAVTGASAFTWVKAADYYLASARLEVKFGSTWYPMHGQHIPQGIGANWRISNGYTRLYPTSVTGNGRFTIETYRSGNWVGREFWVGAYDSSGGGYIVANATADSSANYIVPNIVRNDRAQVIVRCHSGANVYDFALRQGDTWAEVTRTTGGDSASDSLNPAAGCSATVASTSFTGGLRATANDANGLRYLISHPQATTKDTTNGRLYITADSASAQTWQMTPDYQAGVFTTDTTVRDGFLLARSERQRVVAR